MSLPPLPAQTVHLPFEAGPHRMAMGLIAQPPDALVELDDQYRPELAERRHLLEHQRAEVFACLPEAEAASAEVLARLADLLPVRFPDWFHRNGARLENLLTGETWNLSDPGLHPLDLAGRLAQEDWCLLQLTPATPVLAAANLCFPSRWKLWDKIGHPLAVVHGPVPLYAEKLARPVDRFMAQVKPGKLVQRLNWGLIDDPALFQPIRRLRDDADAAFTPDNVAGRIYLRVERQTLSLLPASNFVLFGIRVHVYPLSRIAAAPELAGRLASAVRELPAELQRYKALAGYRDAALAYLDRQAAA